ncbi:MAG: DUF5716 family protein [Lachnospiraceae bacterium]|nr:DUF5716 family protein [Lachnospiraceae bacterium]
MAGSILGVELNNEYSQVSRYVLVDHEPETLDKESENSQIPLAIGIQDGRFVYGVTAKQLAKVSPEAVAFSFYESALKQESVELSGITYTGVHLLSEYLKLILEDFEDIEFLTFSVPYASEDGVKVIKKAAEAAGVLKERIRIQDYRESFCHYMFYQPKALWKYESALFSCDGKSMEAHMLRGLDIKGKKDTFVIVEEVSKATVSDWDIYTPTEAPPDNTSADERFKTFIQGVFEKKIVSSVYLTGAGFENEWFPESLKVLCNGRRAFLGNNLYSRGACYAAHSMVRKVMETPVYLDEQRLIHKISMNMAVEGSQSEVLLVPFGVRWYEADNRIEAILEETADAEIKIEPLIGDGAKTEVISLEGLPGRKDYSLRLQIEVVFLNEECVQLTIRDLGFGDFFESSGFEVSKYFFLGGLYGELYSLS